MSRSIPFAVLLAVLAMPAGTFAREPFEALEYEYTGGEYEQETFRYQLLRPAKLEEGKTYPLILFLHGAGERGDDNEKQLKYLPEYMATPAMREKFPCYLIAPQCRSGKKWVDVDWSRLEPTPAPKEPSHQLKVAIAAMQKLVENAPVDRDRVYLTGLSMGGYGTWDLAARHPEWFAAAAPICGGGDESKAKQYVGLPLWAFHGDQDRAVPLIRTTRMIDAIREAGGEPKLTVYEGVGHNSWDPAYKESELLSWMFEQRRPAKNAE